MITLNNIDPLCRISALVLFFLKIIGVIHIDYVVAFAPFWVPYAVVFFLMPFILIKSYLFDR